MQVSGLLDTAYKFCYSLLCQVYLTRIWGDHLKNLVKIYREERKLTQKELGEKVGVSRQAINAIETGKFDPSIWLAYDLAKFFDVSLETLFLFEESERK